jgi:hypothetical protein
MPIGTAYEPRFRYLLGSYFGAWNMIESTTDYGVGKLLGTTHEQTHLLTAGIFIGRKLTLLRSLAKTNETFKNSEALFKALKTLQSEAKRDVLAHSYMGTSANNIVFVERITHGKFSAREHRFTMPQFEIHTKKVTQASADMYDALQIDDSDYLRFGRAPLSMTDSG